MRLRCRASDLLSQTELFLVALVVVLPFYIPRDFAKLHLYYFANI